MIVVVLVIGTWLGWLVRSTHIQRDAVAAIVNAGGEVNYSWGWTPVSPIPVRRWLMNLIGDDYFGQAVDVRLFPPSTPTDATAAQIARLTQLKRLWLYSATLGDGGLAHLKGLTSLQYLGLIGPKVTDAGLVNLENLTSLRYLTLIDTQVTDAGLVHLKTLTNLKVLVFNSTHITEAGRNNLKHALPNLTIIP